MDIGSKRGYPAGALSNFTPRRFVVRGIEMHSMEGFLQGLKFREPEMQRHVFTLVGLAAKKKGRKKRWYDMQLLWWQGQPIRRSSDEYQALLDEAFQALFTTNEKAKATLLATRDANLTHSMGKRNERETVLTEREFCSRLMRIRGELQEGKREGRK